MRRREKLALPDVGAPAELLDPGHPVWHDQKHYRAYMGRLRWSLPPSERFGVAASPGNRRRFAAMAWAVTTGQLVRTANEGRTQVPDWAALREAGLC